eukprot:2077747-Rhodomonas_salina.2
MMFLWILKEGGDSGVEDGIQVVSGVDGCESGSEEGDGWELKQPKGLKDDLRYPESRTKRT